MLVLLYRYGTGYDTSINTYTCLHSIKIQMSYLYVDQSMQKPTMHCVHFGSFIALIMRHVINT